MKNIFLKLLLIIWTSLFIKTASAQTLCSNPAPLVIGATDSDCNSQTFGTLGLDFDDNTPTAITTVTNTCGVIPSDNTIWYSFTGDGSIVRFKLYNQSSSTRMVVFQNQACAASMTALLCGSYLDDNLPHTIDINTVNGADYKIAITKQTGSATLTGAVCAYKTSGIPYAPGCDPIVNTPPANLTVQLKTNDCFTNFTNVVTSKDQPGNTNDRPTIGSGCDDTQIEYWWGKFTAIDTLTKIFLYGKDGDNASLGVSKGPCGPSLPSILCSASTGSRDIPNYYEVPTVIGQEYYITIKKSMDAGRLCIYSDGVEPTKPFCTADMSFENGGTTGWTFNYGSYHLVSAPGNNFVWDMYNTGTPAALFQLNSGAGRDPNVGMLPVVAPGGGNYSYRIGSIGTAEGAPGTVNGVAGMHAAACQAQYCFKVSGSNAAFGYKYAVVIDYSAHQAELQPLFEVFLTVQSTGDTVKCGHNIHYVGDGYSPYKFIGKATDVSSQSNGHVFVPWTDVITDLSGFVGQTICATFRVRDCEGGGNTTGPPYDSVLYGTHWAYAYFDTYCVPMTITTPEFCAGAPTIQICAPPGYKTYTWPAGQPGLVGSPTTQCVTITNPVGGVTYTVNLMSISGCPVTAKVVLKNIPLTKTADTTFCAPVTSAIPLTVSVTNPVDPPYTYSWSSGLGLGSTVMVTPPSGTTSYVVTVTNGSGCTSNDTIRVTVKPCVPAVNTVGTTICSGACATLTATPSGGQAPYTFSWSPGSGTTAGPFNVCPTTSTIYTISIKDNAGIVATDTALVIVNPTPVINAGPDVAICLNSSTQLNVTGVPAGGSILWSPSAGLSGTTISNPVAAPTTTTSYIVRVTSPEGCSDTDTVTVVVNPNPIVSISPPAAICIGASATLTASGGTIYSWSNGSGGSTITVTPVSTTPYTVTVTDANNCSNTASTSVTVNLPPNVNVSAPVTICNGASVTLTVGGSPANYVWAPGGPGTSITVSPTVTTPYTVTATDANGCITIVTTAINVNQLPIPSINPPSAICQNASITLTASGGTTYLWVPGGSGSSITVSPSSTTTYSLTVTDGNSCTATTSTVVTVNPFLTVTMHPDTAICIGASATVNAWAPNAITYSWSTGVITPSITVSPGTSTTYSVNVTDINGCKGSGVVTVNVNPPPNITASITKPAICIGDNTQINAAGGVSYSWSPIGNTTPSVIITPATTGNYTYTVTGTDANGCVNTANTTLIVNPLPTPTITAPFSICIGTPTTLTAGGGVSYSWSPVPMTGPSININPAATGSYTVTVTDANRCVNTTSTTVTVNPIPIVTMHPDTAICIGASATVNAWAPNTTIYSWSTGALTPSITVSPVTSTTYSVNVTDVNGCKNSVVVTVSVNPLPNITASVTKPAICIGDNTQINAAGGVSYSWAPIGNTTPGVMITPANTGSYTYTVTGTDANGCVNTATTSFVVNPLPTPTITAPFSICTGTPTTLTAGGGVSYSWSPVPLTGPTINITPAVSGNYTVTVTDANGCTNTTSTTVTVNPFLTVTVQPSTICIGQSAVLNAISVGASNFSWSTGGLTPSITVSPSTTTIYTVNVSNSYGCNGDTTVTVTVNPLPVVNVSTPAFICIGASTTITASGGATYSWTISTGGTLTGNSNTVSPTSTTTYNVTVTDANGCKNTGTTNVTVNTLPIVTISPPIAYCQGSSAQLTAGGGVSYTWTPGGVTGASISVNPTVTTTYTVDVTDANGCKGSNAVKVTVYPVPVADAGPDFDICIGQNAQLKPGGVSSIWNYTWNPPTYLSSPNTPNPIFSGPVTTTYTLTVSATNSNCPPATDKVIVTVHPIPPVYAGNDTTILAGSEAQLFATAGGSVSWSPSTALSCTNCFTPIASPLRTTTYVVTTVDAFGCRNRDTVIIFVEDIITLYVPNAFTPNLDGGRNNVFYAYGVGIYNFDFYIFNRWGELVFETHNPHTGWDGTYNGHQVQNDVYVWLAKAKSITGKSISKSGSVTVVQ